MPVIRKKPPPPLMKREPKPPAHPPGAVPCTPPELLPRTPERSLSPEVREPEHRLAVIPTTASGPAADWHDWQPESEVQGWMLDRALFELHTGAVTADPTDDNHITMQKLHCKNGSPLWVALQGQHVGKTHWEFLTKMYDIMYDAGHCLSRMLPEGQQHIDFQGATECATMLRQMLEDQSWRKAESFLSDYPCYLLWITGPLRTSLEQTKGPFAILGAAYNVSLAPRVARAGMCSLLYRPGIMEEHTKFPRKWEELRALVKWPASRFLALCLRWL